MDFNNKKDYSFMRIVVETGMSVAQLSCCMCQRWFNHKKQTVFKEVSWHFLSQLLLLWQFWMMMLVCSLVPQALQRLKENEGGEDIPCVIHGKEYRDGLKVLERTAVSRKILPCAVLQRSYIGVLSFTSHSLETLAGSLPGTTVLLRLVFGGYVPAMNHTNH